MLRSQWHQLNRLPIIARSGSKLTQLWDTIVYNGVTTEPAINVVAARRQFSSESGDEREIENPKVIELAGQIMQLNLLEVSDLTELLRKRLNIQTSFAMPMGGMPAVAPSAGGDQQSTGRWYGCCCSFLVDVTRTLNELELLQEGRRQRQRRRRQNSLCG